jgi:hypothetical protein
MTMHAHHLHSHPDRLIAAVLGLLIPLGSLLLVAIPIGWLWLLSQLGQPYLAVYLLALSGCPVMMAAWGIALARFNRLYSRITGAADGGGQLLEASIVVAVAIAVVILAVWVLLNPSGGGPLQGPWPG